MDNDDDDDDNLNSIMYRVIFGVIQKSNITRLII